MLGSECVPVDQVVRVYRCGVDPTWDLLGAGWRVYSEEIDAPRLEVVGAHHVALSERCESMREWSQKAGKDGFQKRRSPLRTAGRDEQTMVDCGRVMKTLAVSSVGSADRHRAVQDERVSHLQEVWRDDVATEQGLRQRKSSRGRFLHDIAHLAQAGPNLYNLMIRRNGKNVPYERLTVKLACTDSLRDVDLPLPYDFVVSHLFRPAGKFEHPVRF